MLLDNSKVPQLSKAVIVADAFGMSATTPDGEPAKFAILDGNGEVLEAGPQVAAAAWGAMLAARNAFLIGKGHLKVLFPPPPDPKQS